MIKKIEKNKPDIIHKTYFDEFSYKTPTVLTVYDLIHEKFHYLYGKDENYRPKKKAIESADIIICISKSTQEDLNFYYDLKEIFIRFVKKLTSKEEVQDAVNKDKLPLDALNKIDEGQSVNLYDKVMPGQAAFIAFADQPAINPVTGARSGLKGTRKDGFTKAMAIELGKYGIRINTICPTFILTPLTQASFDDPIKKKWILEKIKLGRAGEVEDIMGIAVYLASDASNLVTGSSVMVDGGWTAG